MCIRDRAEDDRGHRAGDHLRADRQLPGLVHLDVQRYAVRGHDGELSVGDDDIVVMGVEGVGEVAGAQQPVGRHADGRADPGRAEGDANACLLYTSRCV